VDEFITRSLDETAQPSEGLNSPLVGFGLAFGMIALGIAMGGSFLAFIDLPSLLIVLGGTFGGMLFTYSMSEFLAALAPLRQTLGGFVSRRVDRLSRLVEIAKKVKADGLVSIEYIAYQENDPFLKRALELLVDNQGDEEFRKTLEIEFKNAGDDYRKASEISGTLGAISPAMGLIGTIIGLVHMLHQLNSPEQIGPGMATALMTTLYGAILSYLVFNPLADKLEIKGVEEQKLREMTYEALLLIHEDLHPRLIEQRLASFAADKTEANGPI
jgi:chemotaxis protein MotA